ncbi:MAG: hypothetical protein SAJ11_20990 [Jaaginema sp. PMC 1078.18]|nr:hypothetical protein [Jaaginema sp. PMC 1078.18]
MTVPITDTETQNVILFNLDRYWLALPVAAVLKVVNFPSHFRTALQQIGVVHLGDTQESLDTPAKAIALLDLHSLETQSTKATVGHFLMVVRLSDRQLIGIPLDEPPSLPAIPTPHLCPLATPQPHHRLLHPVSHVASLAAD